ncbi:MAG: hypothetical protein COA67_02940 [Lutibacter sp.]|nr:MAG: hypothetical protein COA67_02940 [Lutibacter sp.]
MSVYQYGFFIIPRKNVYTVFEGLNLNSFLNNELVDDPDGELELFEDDLFWENHALKFIDISKYFDKKIQRGESWSKNLIIYGHNDENCIKIFLEKDIIVSVGFRINFTLDYGKFLKEVIDFCQYFDFLVVSNDLNILELDFDRINKTIRDSKSFKRFL